MGRAATTLLGLAAVSIAAIWIAKGMLQPTQEKVQRKAPVLTGEYQARLDQCRSLTESEIPDGLPKPKVDEDLLYVEVSMFFPGAAQAPDGHEFRLVEINGVANTALRPVHVDTETSEEGAYLYLVFKTNHEFDAARLARDDKIVVDSVVLP